MCKYKSINNISLNEDDIAWILDENPNEPNNKTFDEDLYDSIDEYGFDADCYQSPFELFAENIEHRCNLAKDSVIEMIPDLSKVLNKMIT